MVDTWFSDIVTTTTTDQRRARCAHAAQQRATAPLINLAGLGGNDVVRRRAQCVEPAFMRFVTRDPTMGPWRYHNGVGSSAKRPTRLWCAKFYLK